MELLLQRLEVTIELKDALQTLYLSLVLVVEGILLFRLMEGELTSDLACMVKDGIFIHRQDEA